MHSTKQPYFEQEKLRVPKQQDIQEVQLYMGCQLIAIHQLEINKHNKNQIKITFLCFKVGKNQCQKIIISKLFHIPNSKQIITRLIKNIIKYHQVSFKLEVHPKCNDEDDLIAQIQSLEHNFSLQKNKQNEQKLIDKYRQAVEYYSAVGQLYYLIYVKKIQDLYKRSIENNKNI